MRTFHKIELAAGIYFTDVILQGNFRTTGLRSNYWSYAFHTYVLLKPNAGSASVDTKIYNALKDYRKEHHPYLRPMSKLYIDPVFENNMYVLIGLDIISVCSYTYSILDQLH